MITIARVNKRSLSDTRAADGLSRGVFMTSSFRSQRSDWVES